jgi:hypothetical protein
MRSEYKGNISKAFKWFMVKPDYLKKCFKKYRWTIETIYFNEEKTCLIRIGNLHNRETE